MLFPNLILKMFHSSNKSALPWSHTVLQVDTENIDVVKKFFIPETQTEFISFLGLAFYYCHYVANLAAIIRLLYEASETLPVFFRSEEAQDVSVFGPLIARPTSTPISDSPYVQQLSF